MKSLNILILALVSICGTMALQADLPRKLYKRIKEANRVGRNCSIQFERHFKYMGFKDTISERVVSEYCANDSGLHTGWHKLHFLPAGQPKSTVVCGSDRISRLDEQNRQMQELPADLDAGKFQTYQNDLLYFPFREVQTNLKRYRYTGDQGQLKVLEYSDSTPDKSGAYRKGHYSLLIDHQFRAVAYRSRISLKGKTQYLYYRLLQAEAIAPAGCKSVSSKADSMLQDMYSRRKMLQVRKNSDTVQLAEQPAEKRTEARKLQTGSKAEPFMIQLGESSTYHRFQLTDSLVLLDFFYSTCAPCIKGQPMLNSLYTRYAPMGLKVFGLNPLPNDWRNLKDYAGSYAVEYPLLRARPEVLSLYHVSGYPRLVLVKNGIITDVFYGYGESTEKDLQLAIERALIGLKQN